MDFVSPAAPHRRPVLLSVRPDRKRRVQLPGSFQHFHLLVNVFVVGEVVLHAIIVMQSPRDARAPKDERERLIDLKAMRVAFFVLMTSAILVIVLVHFPVDRFAIIQALLLAVVVAELTMLGARLVYYRRDV